MILDDLLIYGDWLEENYIKNNLYKQFLNHLRIKLRKNNNFKVVGYGGSGNGNGYSYGNGYGYGADMKYGTYEGDGKSNFFEFVLDIRTGDGSGTGNGVFDYGDHAGDGWSI